MRIIRQYQNGYADILAEKPIESLYEKGDYIEVFDGSEYQDYRIFDYAIEDNQHIYQCRIV